MLVKGEYSIKQLNPKVLFSPAMIAAFLAALLVALGVRTPDVVGRPITMVGAITVPAALMIIGSSMARLPLRQIVGSPKVYVSSAVRLLVVPLSIYALFRFAVSATLSTTSTRWSSPCQWRRLAQCSA